MKDYQKILEGYREEMIGVLKERGLSWRVYTGGR